MKRTLFCSFVGAGIGVLAAIVFGSMTGALSSRDGGALIILFIGTFLAGIGAIAGAIIGGVAELMTFLREKEQTRESQVHSGMRPGA
jgi:hypothetical protein